MKRVVVGLFVATFLLPALLAAQAVTACVPTVAVPRSTKPGEMRR